jgi:hypothetical protein
MCTVILRIFDNGWGDTYPLKQFEQSITTRILTRLATDGSRTVIINSVWYTGDYHQQVIRELKSMTFDRIILIAMIDAAIPRPEWYSEFGCEVLTLGYYPGINSIDFWALAFAHHTQPADISVLLDENNIDVAFMCLNRKPHWHRRKLFSQLTELNLIDRGFVSMGSDHGPAIKKLEIDQEHDDLAPNAARDHHGVPNDIASLGHIANWQRHLLNIVTETCFDINKNYFVSEKIYKPIVGCRPFLVYDPDGATAWLAERSFESYVLDWKDISDLDLTVHDNIPLFLKILCHQPRSYWQKKFVDLRDKILYNKSRFNQYVSEQKSKINQGIQCQT